MKPWKQFLPKSRDLENLMSITPIGLFANRSGDPVMESLYFLSRDGDWISLSWGYADVEFKFEMYFIDLNHLDGRLPEDLISIADISEPSSMQFLLRTEWIRPAHPGEVRADFDQVVEESGTAASVPPSATAIGTCLYGIVFSDAESRPLLAVTLDDNERYSLKCITEAEGIHGLIEAWDCCNYSQMLMWRPSAAFTD